MEPYGPWRSMVWMKDGTEFFWVCLRLGDTRVSTCPLCLLVNALVNGRDIRLFIILRAMIGFKFFKSHFLVTDHGVCVGSFITVALLKNITINSNFKEIQSLWFFAPILVSSFDLLLVLLCNWYIICKHYYVYCLLALLYLLVLLCILFIFLLICKIKMFTWLRLLCISFC